MRSIAREYRDHRLEDVCHPNELLPQYCSTRLLCFKRNIRCVCCGLTANKLILQSPSRKDGETPHWNLWFVSEEYNVLFTKDHIIPKSKGGADDLSNLQTMCELCNSTKSNLAVTLDELAWLVAFRQLNEALWCVSTLITAKRNSLRPHGGNTSGVDTGRT